MARPGAILDDPKMYVPPGPTGPRPGAPAFALVHRRGRPLRGAEGVRGAPEAVTVGHVIAGVDDPDTAARRSIGLASDGSADDDATAPAIDVVPAAVVDSLPRSA